MELMSCLLVLSEDRRRDWDIGLPVPEENPEACRERQLAIALLEGVVRRLRSDEDDHQGKRREWLRMQEQDADRVSQADADYLREMGLIGPEDWRRPREASFARGRPPVAMPAR